MLYRPNFCCNCGEKIERAEWSLTTSRKFCDPCSAELKAADWAAKIIAGVLLVVAFAGISILFAPTQRSSEMRFSNVATAESVSAPLPVAGNSSATLPSSQQSQTPSNSNASSSLAAGQQPLTAVPKLKATEAVYFCGAQTKKGTPCSRRVKRLNERCWQHAGMPAMTENVENSKR
jgi:hypothetical protein